MILTRCAVCATELGLSLGKKCGRCSTRYCGPECQVQHWNEGGHDTLQTNKKGWWRRAVQRQKKYTEAVWWRRKCAEDEGPGVLHLHAGLALKTKASCAGARAAGRRVCARVVAEQAKILLRKYGEQFGRQGEEERWNGGTVWSVQQDYHGVVVRARLGVLETSGAAGGRLGSAITQLGNGLLRQAPRGRVVRARG